MKNPTVQEVIQFAIARRVAEIAETDKLVNIANALGVTLDELGGDIDALIKQRMAEAAEAERQRIAWMVGNVQTKSMIDGHSIIGELA